MNRLGTTAATFAVVLFMHAAAQNSLAQDEPRRNDGEPSAQQERRGGNRDRGEQGQAEGPRNRDERGGRGAGGEERRRGGQGGGQGGRGQRGGGQGGGSAIFRLLDADRDGQLSVKEIDNADPRTGMEYANTNIGDGGFILKLGDGTVTNARWKAKKFSWGPINGDTEDPKVENIPIPKNWYSIDFDDSKWPNAREFSEEEVGPKEPFYEHDFKGTKFIWSDDVLLDNVVIFRTVVKSPPDAKERADFRGLTDVVPQRPQRGGGGNRRRGKQGTN